MFHRLKSMRIAAKLGMRTVGAVHGIIVLAALFLLSERSLILEERKTEYHN